MAYSTQRRGDAEAREDCHWSAQYIGRPYAETNCAELAALVQREVFGRAIALPDAMPTFAGHQSKMIDALGADYAYRVACPEDGDAVLMQCRGRLSHVGVFCDLQGGYVLHAVKNAGQVVLHRVRDLGRVNLVLEGYYRWR